MVLAGDKITNIVYLNSSTLYPAFSNAFFTECVSPVFNITVSTLSGCCKSTLHSVTSLKLFKNGVTFDTQPLHFNVVLNLNFFSMLLSFIGLYNSYNFFHLILKLLVTTDTELKAIAAAAIIGLSKKPLIQYNTPAAKGIPIIL